MSVFLLLLGGVTVVAGLVMAGSGVSIHDRTFDTELVTPGTIAVVGGFLLVGIGLAVQELQRIERALATKPIPRPARPPEVPAAAVSQSADNPVRIPFPSKPRPNPQPVPAGVSAATAPAEDAALEDLRVKFPVVAAADVPSIPQAPARSREEVGEIKETAAVGRAGNGAARVVPRQARAAVSPAQAKGSVFNALWPPRQDTRTVSAHATATAAALPPPLPPPIPPLPVAETGSGVGQAAAVDPAMTAAVSILKSGVVEGMAYTLYSDGSIEAQLPQGTLRFGSIAALRNHIESAP
jgi:hypothetical protein